MSETSTTVNGFEIENPTPVATAEQFKARMAGEYGLDADTPAGRAEQLKRLSNEGVAIMLEDINKMVQGSQDSLMRHDKPGVIGEQQAIAIEDRYEVFTRMIDAIKSASQDVNPERIGDMLALGTVLLHPFEDGSGRTARTIGLLLRDNFDSADYESDYAILTQSREEARGRGEWVPNGYIPKLPEGVAANDAEGVGDYIEDLLTDDSGYLYTGPFGQAALHGDTEATVK